ncbi:MAG: 16S rRNA (guanine(527)-N(7))-methyltransferase RsmG [Clostridiales bacterium]|nr:16S rRNA (guanine(527)-N(7))-methyltransferase RsmG [Clostridiales bacterium]
MGDLRELLIREGIPIGEDRMSLLETYFDMLSDWNERMDLTSVPPAEMPARHFLDSLLPLRDTAYFFPGARLIDVGSGAGFPGLALAAARPDVTVTLLEAQGKRCRFLNAVRERLRLQNVAVIQDRAETLGRDPAHREGYDLAVARAVAGLNVLLEYLLPFVKEGGYALCWKGPAAEEELNDGRAAATALGGEIGAFREMISPAMEGRHLIVPVYKCERTAPQYPRKNGMPAKRPLKADKK